MLNPLFLWFLPLAAVPIILHLITLYRLRTVELSTFRFLMDSYIQQRRKLRLLEWLLMALRTAFILLIVVALSRPVVERMGFLFGKSGKDVTLIVDASATMSLETSGTTGMQRAKEIARTIARKLNPADHVTLIAAGHKPDVAYREFVGDAAAVIRRIDALEPDLSAADLPAALAEAVAAPPRGPRVIYILSDARKRTWAPLPQHPIRRQLGEQTQMVLVNVAPTQRLSNLAVIGEPPRAGRPVVGLPVILSATVSASGYDQPIDTRLAVVLEDQIDSQLSLTLQPNQTVTRTFSITPKHAGLIRGRFELPADAFPGDNQFQFCLSVEPQIRVLLITSPAAKPADDPEIYLRTALRAPLVVRGITGEEEKRIAQSLSVTTVRADQFNEGHLANVDVIIAADLALDGNRANLLRRHLEHGGGLLILAGPHVDPTIYNGEILANAAAPGQSAAALRLEPAVGDINDEATFKPVTSFDLRHFVLAAFDGDKDQSFGPVRLFRYMPIHIESIAAGAAKWPKPIDPTKPPTKRRTPNPDALTAAQNLEGTAGVATPLMRLADQTVVMAETRIGPGSVLLCSFSAAPDWSNLPIKAPFVPLLLRSVAHLRPAAIIETSAVVRPHEPARLRVDGAWAGARVQAVDPAGRSQTIDLHRADDHMIGALMNTSARGYYTFTVQPPAEAASQASVQLGFAVNPDTGEADFASLKKSELESTFTPLHVTYLAGSPDDPVLRDALTQRSEIWRWLIWAMFIIIGVEFALSTLKPGGGDSDKSRWPGFLSRFRRRHATSTPAQSSLGQRRAAAVATEGAKS